MPPLAPFTFPIAPGPSIAKHGLVGAVVLGTHTPSSIADTFCEPKISASTEWEKRGSVSPIFPVLNPGPSLMQRQQLAFVPLNGRVDALVTCEI